MKKAIIILLAIISTLYINTNRLTAQNVQTNPKPAASGWTTNNPFHTDVFVENKGQFNNWVETKTPVLYAINNSDKIFFTKQGVIFKLIKRDTISEEEREHQERELGKEADKEQKIFYVTMNWEGCNANAELIAGEQSEGYYTFGEKGYENVMAKGYKKLLYKDIYPNIDLEYTIPTKGGIKYKIILHPGADASLIKMHYTGDVEEMKIDKEGNIIIETEAGDITDHTPESYFEANKAKINSSFILNKNTVSFQLPTSNSQLQTIIIDPWTITPTSLDSNNVALDIDYDKNGNVYFSGGSVPYKLSKYSSTGTLLWTFTNPANWANALNIYYYSKFCVLTNSGTTYIGEGYGGNGCRIMKINNTGVLSNTSSSFGTNNETWRMFYNNCSNQLIAFGGGTNSDHNIKIITDTNLSSSISKNFDGVICTNHCNDITSVVMDNNGDFYALLTSYIGCAQVEGFLKKSLYLTSYSPPCAFDVQTYYQFKEGYILQGITGSAYTVRANALALNNNYLFSYDGKTLKVWNKTIGSMLDSIIVNNNYAEGMYRTHEGIDVDECNNVYIGGLNKIHVYSFNGTTFNTLIPITTNINGEVHDIKLNRVNGKLYICGNGFVTVLNVPISCIASIISNNITIDSCLGKICINANGGTPPYSYKWSNGSIDSCITGLSSGTYIVTVTDNSCVKNTHIDTISFNLFNHTTISPVNPIICSGDSIVLVASNNSGVLYHWSNGFVGISNTVFPSNTLIYSVITTNNVCQDTASVLVKVNPKKQTNLSPIICQGESVQVGIHNYYTNGIYIDSLFTFLGCDSIVIINLTVNPVKQITINPIICMGDSVQVGTHVYTNTGIYLDTLTTANGCDSIITTKLIVGQIKHITLNPAICQGEFYNVGIHNYNITGVYNDTLSTLLGCDSILTTNLSIIPTPYFNIGNDTILCSGSSLILKVFYPNAIYSWNNNTSDSSYNIDKTGLYWVKITDTTTNCFSFDSINIMFIICKSTPIYIPNAFTPNGDGKNDLFKIETIAEFKEFKMYIYDRWGELLFESDDKNYGWDGTYKDKSVPQGVCVYLLTGIIKDTNEQIKRAGSVTVVR